MRGGNPRFAPAVLAAVNAFLDSIRPVAEAHHVTLSQLVIAWSFHQPGVTHVLCGARNLQQAQENAAAGRLKLTSQEIHHITGLLNQAQLKVPKVFG
jgi:aryl-alcohol dehydrogenase-like predicted oxidoreductase